MFNRWPTCVARLVLALVCAAALSAIEPAAGAQTLEIQDEIAGKLELQRESWFGYLKWAWRWARILETEVDTTSFQAAPTFKGALDNAYDQFAARGIELDFLVDAAALETLHHGKEIWERRLDMSVMPERMTLGRLLVFMLKQRPDIDATVVVHYSFLEITTTRAAAGRDRSFHVLRHAATFARYWLLIATICTLLFLVTSASAIRRRNEGRLAGMVGLSVRGALVFLFWPIWLTVVGIGLTRRLVT